MQLTLSYHTINFASSSPSLGGAAAPRGRRNVCPGRGNQVYPPRRSPAKILGTFWRAKGKKHSPPCCADLNPCSMDWQKVTLSTEPPVASPVAALGLLTTSYLLVTLVDTVDTDCIHCIHFRALYPVDTLYLKLARLYLTSRF